MSSKKAEELARDICSNLGSDHHSHLVAEMIQESMSELLDKTNKLCAESADYDYGEEMQISTDNAKDLSDIIKDWTER